jgi:hypothetical protein
MTTAPMWWPQLLVRGLALFVGIVLVRYAIYGLRGRPLIVPQRMGGTREVRGWSARLYGVLALVAALFCFLFVFLEPWVK